MIAIVDYGMGNVGSIANMIKKVGGKAIVSSDPEEIKNADKIILPGVGSFDNAITKLNELDLIEAIRVVVNSDKYFLGICLGMQLLADSSEEGSLPGLGLIKGEVKKFNFSGNLKVPHMGWNFIKPARDHKLFANFQDMGEIRYYFVHSFYYETSNVESVLSSTEYGFNFTSSVIKDNIVGVQFHPEKSHQYGMRFFKNFNDLR